MRGWTSAYTGEHGIQQMHVSHAVFAWFAIPDVRPTRLPTVGLSASIADKSDRIEKLADAAAGALGTRGDRQRGRIENLAWISDQLTRTATLP
jgi:hypothetical protein